MRIVILTALAVILVAGSAIAVKKYVIDSRGIALPDRLPGYASPALAGPGQARGGCGLGQGAAAGRGCCNVTGASAPVDLDALGRQALEYYAATYKDAGVTVDVRDFGCHQEAYILKGGEVVKRLSISGGRMYEI